jgi:hypothetical protein
VRDGEALHCPLCHAEAPEAPASCPRCGADLAGYWRLFFLPWALYARALRRAEEGAAAAAARDAHAAVVLAPGRGEFRMLLARLLAEGGELDEAVEHAQAACLDAAHAEAAGLLLEGLLERKFGKSEGAGPRTS